MAVYQIYCNKATEDFFRAQVKPDESIASCIARVVREFAATHNPVIDADNPTGKSACVVNLANLIREGK